MLLGALRSFISKSPDDFHQIHFHQLFQLAGHRFATLPIQRVFSNGNHPIDISVILGTSGTNLHQYQVFGSGDGNRHTGDVGASRSLNDLLLKARNANRKVERDTCGLMLKR